MRKENVTEAQKIFAKNFSNWAWGKLIPEPLPKDVTEIEKLILRYYQETNHPMARIIEASKQTHPDT